MIRRCTSNDQIIAIPTLKLATDGAADDDQAIGTFNDRRRNWGNWRCPPPRTNPIIARLLLRHTLRTYGGITDDDRLWRHKNVRLLRLKRRRNNKIFRRRQRHPFRRYMTPI
ncbi:MAG: hypothetical protein ACK559_32780, partial [bacterium]